MLLGDFNLDLIKSGQVVQELTSLLYFKNIYISKQFLSQPESPDNGYLNGTYLWTNNNEKK